MKINWLRGPQVGILVLLLTGLAVPALAQQPGPMAAPAATPDAAANTQAPSPAPPASAAPQPAPTAPPSAAPASAAPVPAPAKIPQIEVPSGTHIPLVLHNGISTRSARPGDPVYFETVFPVMIDGKVVIPAGSYVSGEVTESKRPGRVKGRGELGIKLTTMILPNAYMVNLNAAPSGAGTGGDETVNSEGKIVGASSKGSDVGTVIRTTEEGTGIGAGVGAASGNVGRGAGIGAGVGALTGLGAVLLTRGPEAELPRGSTVEAVIDRPIFLDSDKVQFTGPGQASALAGPPDRERRWPGIPF
ncbi:MAG: hypothetical protein ABSG27_01240 [Candidatus Acidiferrales bacterium]|jgi:hypothetical protein